MRVIAIISGVLCVTLAMPVYGSARTPAYPAQSVESLPLVPASRESTVTRITNVQEPYGIAGVFVEDSSMCTLLDMPDFVQFGRTHSGTLFGAWVVWDLAGLPEGAEVIRVEIEDYFGPSDGNEPGVRLVYRKMEGAYLPPPECWSAWSCLTSCPAYTDVDMGTEYGTRRYVLGGSAVSDVQDLVSGRSLFCVGLTVDYSDGLVGLGSLPGWNAGGADLLITWRDSTPAKAQQWGAIKGLFRR
jgi:hypothetical protein